MTLYYCTATGQTPQASRDWASEQATVRAIAPDATDPDTGEETDTSTRDAAQAELNASRLAITEHVVRNGNRPRVVEQGRSRVLTLAELADATLEGTADAHGGRLLTALVVQVVNGIPTQTATDVLCPECSARVRAVETP